MDVKKEHCPTSPEDEQGSLPSFEGLKFVIQELYVVRSLPLKEVQEHISAKVGFSASEAQWKQQLAIWKMHKNMPAQTTKDAIDYVQKTEPSLLSKPSSDRIINIGDSRVQLSKMKRHLRRQPSPYGKLSPRGLGTPAQSPTMSVCAMSSSPCSAPNLSPRMALESSAATKMRKLTALSSISEPAWSEDDTFIFGASESQEPSKSFACPYSKRYPLAHAACNMADRAQRSCANALLRDIPYLKQHLYRAHKLPDHQCPRCSVVYQNASKLSLHIRSGSCAVKEQLYEGKMSPEQYEQIKKRHRNADSVQVWYETWDTLFPGLERPSSPYAEDPGHQQAVQHLVNIFGAIGLSETRRLQTLVRASHDQDISSDTLPSATQQILDEAICRFDDRRDSGVTDLSNSTVLSEYSSSSIESTTYGTTANDCTEASMDTLAILDSGTFSFEPDSLFLGDPSLYSDCEWTPASQFDWALPAFFSPP